MAKQFKKPDVCKPCWELKYCPYGVLVEMMPHPDQKRTKAWMAEHGEPDWTVESLFEDAKASLQRLSAKGPFDESELWERMFRIIRSDPSVIEYFEQFDPEEIRCNIFGHVCPVFGHAYLDVTETKETRKTGRYIPRDIMLRVVRRDNYICQECGKHVPDSEVEFDHVIPHARGGPLSVENIRLLCRDCNRKKSDSFSEMLDLDWNRPK